VREGLSGAIAEAIAGAIHHSASECRVTAPDTLASPLVT
jgi:hypothetical protein